MSKGKTAILFFSRTLNDEFRAKPIGSKQRFKSLYQFFVNKSLQTARSSGLPVIEIYSNQQDGDSFGERLVNSLKTVRDRGYNKVIVIGNDAPELSVDDLHLASQRISRGDSILGKDKRGGTYLIGLDLTRNLSFLESVNWSSSSVYDQLKRKLKNVYDLSVKADVNSLEDIESLAKNRNISRGAVLFLRSHFWGVMSCCINNNDYFRLVVSGCEYRGPPSLVA